MIEGALTQVVEQCLNESMGDYIVENMIERVVNEGAQVVGRVEYDNIVNSKEDENYEQIQDKCVEWALQECLLMAVIEMGQNKK